MPGYALPEALGKENDSRMRAFVARFGRNVQVELEALDPDVMRELLETVVARYWDDEAFAALERREAADRDRMREFIETWPTD